MSKSVRKCVLVSLSVVLILAMITGGVWLVQRMAIGTWRHALNHQGGQRQQAMWLEIKAGCSRVNDGRIWVEERSPAYVRDRYATSSEIYQYIVLDNAVLSDAGCLTAVMTSMRKTNHQVSIAISNKGAEVAYFHFYPGEK